MMATDTEILHFLSTYTTKNLTRAAGQLSITQPALTQSLKRLEDKLGTNLFIRTKRGCTPTEAADILFEKATRLREHWQEIQDTLSGLKNNLSGKFRIGCHPSVGGYTLPSIFRELDQKASEIRLELVHDMSKTITDQVLRLEVDLALVINPVKHNDLIMHKLGTDHLAFWKSSQVRDIPRIIFSDMPEYELKKKLKGKTKGLSEHKFVETKSLELIRSLVHEGAGIGLLPERVARMDSGIRKMLELPTLADSIQLIYRYDTLKSSAGRVLVQAAKNCL